MSSGRDPFLVGLEEDTLPRSLSLLAGLNSTECRTVSLLAWGISLVATRGDAQIPAVTTFPGS